MDGSVHVVVPHQEDWGRLQLMPRPQSRPFYIYAQTSLDRVFLVFLSVYVLIAQLQNNFLVAMDKHN